MKLITSALLLTLLNAIFITTDLIGSGYSEYDIPTSKLDGINPNKFLQTDERKLANLAHASDRDVVMMEQEDTLKKILAYNAKLQPAPRDPKVVRQEKLAFNTKIEPRKHYLLSSLD